MINALHAWCLMVLPIWYKLYECEHVHSGMHDGVERSLAMVSLWQK